MNYQFTNTWFADTANWGGIIPIMKGRKEFLEIGCYEGQSTVFTVNNMMQDGGVIYCVDTWGGGEEHQNDDMAKVESRFDHNINMLKTKHDGRRRIEKMKGSSYQKLVEIAFGLGEDAAFDFIYIDGSHIAKDVLSDACMCWPMLKPGGLLVFDDYLWGNRRDILHRPKVAVDAFMNIFAEEVQPVYMGGQLIVAKGNL